MVRYDIGALFDDRSEAVSLLIVVPALASYREVDLADDQAEDRRQGSRSPWHRGWDLTYRRALPSGCLRSGKGGGIGSTRVISCIFRVAADTLGIRCGGRPR